MPYATRKDIEDLYGKEIIEILADQDEDYPDDLDLRVNAAIQAASDEIDSYLIGNYVLPLATTPPQLKVACRDIAIYRLALKPGPRTDEMRKRYEDWIKWLTNIAKGVVHLVPPKVADPVPGPDGENGGTLPRRGIYTIPTLRS